MYVAFASGEGSGESAQMRRLSQTFAVRVCNTAFQRCGTYDDYIHLHVLQLLSTGYNVEMNTRFSSVECQYLPL